MTQRATDSDNGVARESQMVETVIKAFWERARSAAGLITQLREEKQILAKRVGEIEGELETSRAEIFAKDQELKRLRAEHAQLLDKDNGALTLEEKERLKARVKELIAKINSHL